MEFLGGVPGGVVAETTAKAISERLSPGLWHLLETVTDVGLRPILPHYPRLSSDFDYLWTQLYTVVETRQTRESAVAIGRRVADPGMARHSG